MSDPTRRSGGAFEVERRRAVMARGAGLELVGRANRWMISGAVVFAAGVSAVTAHAFHSRGAVSARSSAPATRQSGRSTDDREMPSSRSPAPSARPTPAATSQAPAPVVSGGS